jgi:hypothetical protein
MSDEVESVDSTDIDGAEAEVSSADVQHSPEPVAQPSPWDSFKQLPQFQGQDDQVIARSLYQAMQREEVASRQLRQYQQAVPLVQQYLSHRPEYEKWLATRNQQQPQAPQPPQEKPKGWWNPPELKDSYKRYLVKDESGRDTIHPDAPLDARAALSEWMDYRADFAQKFLANPEQALGPMVQELAQKQAQEIIEKTLEKRDNESYVEQVEADNRDWLFDPETGSVSPAGLLVNKYIEQAKSHGINGPKARWEYAVAMTERDLLAQQFDSTQSQPVPQPVQQMAPTPEPQVAQPVEADPAQKNMEYLRKEASRNVSRSAGAANTDPRQPRQKQSFEQMLLSEANNKGFL